MKAIAGSDVAVGMKIVYRSGDEVREVVGIADSDTDNPTFKWVWLALPETPNIVREQLLVLNSWYAVAES